MRIRGLRKLPDGSSLSVCCLAGGNLVLKDLGFYSRAVGDIQENLSQDASLMMAATSAPDSVADHCQSEFL